MWYLKSRPISTFLLGGKNVTNIFLLVGNVRKISLLQAISYSWARLIHWSTNLCMHSEKMFWWSNHLFKHHFFHFLVLWQNGDLSQLLPVDQRGDGQKRPDQDYTRGCFNTSKFSWRFLWEAASNNATPFDNSCQNLDWKAGFK